MGKKGLVILAVTCFVFLLLYFGFLQIQIIRYSQVEVEEDVDYVMILGARVMGSTPSLSLQYRIDTAAEYLLKNKKAIAIATGGRGPGEDITEAEAIKKELVKKGIEESRIF
ncbi:integral membrane protein [Halalkalibacter wakoensis JCM 9140]|uniref:Integral membrane protein n=1 Tax=Halalkalibacter wakoensis JCM 9140 TaxID=1236970 RepID=W4PZ33_9BACI|nr:integral membrane protein [Halalkalibacter wakoensis JCM 9140]